MAVYQLKGRVDSLNANEIGDDMMAFLEREGEISVDAEQLEYISSAGLRALLRLRTRQGSLRIFNVQPAVWDILEMTGFTEVMTVEKALRRMSVEGCAVIGRGAKGTVYRVSPDTILKVYNDPDSLDAIRHEREMARKAFVLGLPTAISFDVVRVGDKYGSMFELLDCASMTRTIRDDPAKLPECVRVFADVLRRLHNTPVRPGEMPDANATLRRWAEQAGAMLDADTREKVNALVNALPASGAMVHGDYHMNNVLLQNGEPMIIDMDTLAAGHPVFDLANIWVAYVGFAVLGAEMIEQYMGLPLATTQEIWRQFLPCYLKTADEAVTRSAGEKAELLGSLRILQHILRRGMEKSEPGASACGQLIARVRELAARTDTLLL